MKQRNLKKLLILNIPYMFIGLYATKLSEGWRLVEGADASQKFLNCIGGLGAAFQSPFPSFHPVDLLRKRSIITGNNGAIITIFEIRV